MKDLLRNLGARIKEERKSRGLTQELLAEKLQITPRYLSRLEVGQQSPSIETLVKLAKVLEVELHELFKFGHLGTRKELRGKLLQLIRGLDERKLRLIVKLCQAVG